MKKCLLVLFSLLLMSSSPVFAASDTEATIDFNGNQVVLDADGDTSITADTDDQIDIEVSGADDFQITANTFTVPAGSTIDATAGSIMVEVGTVASLVTCAAGTQGSVAVVTDGSSGTDCTTGSGSDVNLCFCDGTNYITSTA